MNRRARPSMTSNGPERTDLPFEFEICAFLDSVDRLPCNHFEISFLTEHIDSVWTSRNNDVWFLSNGHKISNVEYFAPTRFKRNWIEYLVLGTLKRRVYVLCNLNCCEHVVEPAQ